MTLPSAHTLCTVIDTTWPAASKTVCHGIVIREGRGGGSRVSAATADSPITIADLRAAETAMRAIGQTPLFMVRPGHDELDTLLESEGYRIKDSTLLYAAPIALVAATKPPPVTSFQVWPPLQVQREIWADGGIGPARIAVMDRAACPKSTFLGRLNDRPAATAYAAIAEGCVMMHALEVAQHDRRQGLAAFMTHAVAIWGEKQGADWMTLATTRANSGANALYTSLGMRVVGQYHYRIKVEENSDQATNSP